MKILLLGEYSNVHATLSKALKKRGHEVLSISNGDFWKNYPRDIDLSRRYTKLGGLLYWLKVMMLLPRLRNFDIVQIINPMFLELKAQRIFPIYNYLKNTINALFFALWEWTIIGLMPAQFISI